MLQHSTKTTYRLVILGKKGKYTYGETAASPELAKLVPGALVRGDYRLGIEQTEWAPNDHNQVVTRRTVLIEAEEHAGQWEIGA